MFSKSKKTTFVISLLGLSLFLLVMTSIYSNVGLKECKNCPAPFGCIRCEGGGSCDGFDRFTCTDCLMRCYDLGGGEYTYQCTRVC
jgi:hypothetical protein